MNGIRAAIRNSTTPAEANEEAVLAEIRAATGKVSFKLTVSQQVTELTPHELNFALHCLLVYGESARRFSFGPHHADLGTSTRPSGYQFTVSADAPLLTAPFHRRTLGNGVLAFPLDAGFACTRTESGAPLDEHHLMSSRVRTAIDLSITDARLGGDERNFAGIFTSRQRSGARVIRQYWAVVQANDLKESEKFFDHLQAAEREGRTWQDTFIDTDKLSSLVNVQRQYRARLLCALLQACELGPVCRDKDIAMNIDAVLESTRCVDNVHDVVEAGLPGELTYLNGMASNRAVTSSGIVVREAGRLGVTLLNGPLGATKNKRDVGFPCWTGHRQSPFVTSGNENNDDESEATAADRMFFWDNCNTERYRHNLTLSIDGAHVRQSKRWRDIESWLGHANGSEEIALEPVVVKLHSTEPPRSLCNGACSGIDDESSCEL